MSPERVLITDAEVRGTLAACRSLHRAGYEVDPVAATRPAVSHWSRSCSRRLIAPDPRQDRRAFVDALALILEGDAYDVLLPASDAALLAISEHRDRLPEVRTGLPSHQVVLRWLSKWEMVDAALAAGLHPPRTVPCESLADAVSAAAELGYPVLVKPWTSVAPDSAGIRQRASTFVRDRDALERVVADCGPPVLLQQRLDAHVFSLGGVRAGGQLLGQAYSRYERTWPANAGSVSSSETVALPADLERRAAALLDELDLQGIFELELLRDSDGRFAAIDFNPRVYGSLELAARAGVPLATLWCDWLVGRAPSPVQARAGVRYRWEDAEARNLLQRIRSGRFRDAFRILRPRAGTAHAHVRLGDPGPLLARSIAAVRSRRRDRKPVRRGYAP